MRANKSLLQDAINRRLEEYGYSYQNTPDKYNSYSAIRRTISLRLGLSDGRENLTDYQLEQAKIILDEVLPKKEDNKENNKMGKILETLEKVKDGFLKAYNMHYSVDGKPYTYELVSRNELSDPSQLGAKANAVTIVPIFKDMSILISKEFRYAINDYCYEFPAGLIDAGETIQDAAIRELKEETGLDVSEVLLTLPAGYSSAGMTDERVAVVFCLVNGEIVESTGKEEIHSTRISIDDAAKIVLDSSAQVSCRFQLIITALTMSNNDTLASLLHNLNRLPK